MIEVHSRAMVGREIYEKHIVYSDVYRHGMVSEQRLRDDIEFYNCSALWVE